ncbi:MAG: rane protein [Rariglobus sp.]|jgi:hypothetical protein|nr:rane protein [Rariglobus sp.]
MIFLNAPLLWSLAGLLALPLVIHLLNKRFPQRFLFSSVDHLKKSAAERARIYKWRHRILTLVRTLFLLLLLFVFLKPVLDRFGANAQTGPVRRQVLLIVDHSLSMEYQQAGLTSRQRAVIEAGKILGTLGDEDEVNVIAVSHAPAICFGSFTRNFAEARRFLQTLPSGVTRADFTQANAAAARLLAATKNRVEVYYLSDFQRRNWALVDFAPLADRAKLFFVDVGAESPENRAILGAELNQSQVLAGDTVPLEITIGNFSSAPLDDVITVRVDQRHQVQQPVAAGPWSSVRVTVPVPATTPGLHLCEITLPRDNLAADNRWTLVLPVLEKEEIVTLSSDGDAGKDPVRYLHAALNPYPNQAGSLLPRHLASASLDATRLAGSSKLFVTRCGPLDDAAADALAKFLHRGGGIVWFLDSETDAANLQRLEKAMATTPLPLRVGPLRKTDNVGSGAQQIVTGDFKARILRLFRGNLRQDLGLLEFYDFHAASATGSGKVLLRFGDETPAMAMTGHGLGTLVLMNFSVGEFSSNLARQRIFPAWVQDLVKQLDAREPVPLAFAAGQLVTGEVWRDDLRRQPFTSPSGRVIDVHQEPLGERAGVSFPAEEIGFYTLADGRLKYAFAVNADPEESDLRVVDKAHLPAQLTAGQESGFAGGQGDYDEIAHGRSLVPWFLLAAVGVLLLELVLQLVFRRLAR